MKEWSIFPPRVVYNLPSTISQTRVYGIMIVNTGKLLICNDGDGFYGVLTSDVSTISFKSNLYKNLEAAKGKIIDEFLLHCNNSIDLYKKQIDELLKV